MSTSDGQSRGVDVWHGEGSGGVIGRGRLPIYVCLMSTIEANSSLAWCHK